MVYPLVPEEIIGFCDGQDARCWCSRKASRSSSSRRSPPSCAAPTCQAKLHGKDVHAHGGRVHRRGAGARPGAVRRAARARTSTPQRGAAWLGSRRRRRSRRPPQLLGALPARPPTLLRRLPRAAGVLGDEAGRAGHRPAAHRRWTSAATRSRTFEPFSQGNTLLGYGMSLAAAAGVSPMSSQRAGGDHGRRRLLAQRPALRRARRTCFNKGDGVLRDHEERLRLGHRHAGADLLAARGRAHGCAVGESAAGADRTIENTLTGLGVKWLRTVNNYDVGEDGARRYKEAMTTTDQGPEGDRRRGRMPARAAAPRSSRRSPDSSQKGERVRAREVRRRRGHLHRRPLVHPPLRLPDAHREGQPRSAARATRWRR